MEGTDCCITACYVSIWSKICDTLSELLKLVRLSLQFDDGFRSQFFQNKVTWPRSVRVGLAQTTVRRGEFQSVSHVTVQTANQLVQTSVVAKRRMEQPKGSCAL